MPNYILFYHHYHTDSALKSLFENFKILGKISGLINKIHLYAWNVHNFDQQNQIYRIILGIFKTEKICIHFSKNNPPSENITLSYIKKTIELYPDNLDFVIYAHSKGASYRDPHLSMLVARVLLEGINAFAEYLFNDSNKLSQYNVFGVRLALGVFERYGVLKKHFSGNIWMARSKYIKGLKDFTPQELILPCYRHQAECWISSSTMFKPFNGLMGIIIEELQQGVVPNIIKQNAETFSEISALDKIKIDNLLEKYIYHIVEQQSRYDSARFAWSFRKKLFGNDSFLMTKNGRWVIERLENWERAGLYRHYYLPSHFDLVKYI